MFAPGVLSARLRVNAPLRCPFGAAGRRPVRRGQTTSAKTKCGARFIETYPIGCYLNGIRRRAFRRATKEDDVLSYDSQAVQQPATPVAAMTANPRTFSSEQLLERITQSLENDKADDLVSIDLRGKTAMADYMVICSGRSTRQVASLAEKLVERLKADFGVIARSEGKDMGDWVLIDAGDVIVHIFRPEVREFYQLEKMWMPGSAPAQTQA